jgi:hypothetical protein
MHARPIENCAGGRGAARILSRRCPQSPQEPFDARCARVTFPAKQKADSAQGPKRKAAPGKRKQQGASAERLPSSGKKSKEREAKLIERLLYSEDAFDSEDERA